MKQVTREVLMRAYEVDQKLERINPIFTNVLKAKWAMGLMFRDLSEKSDVKDKSMLLARLTTFQQVLDTDGVIGQALVANNMLAVQIEMLRTTQVGLIDEFDNYIDRLVDALETIAKQLKAQIAWIEGMEEIEEKVKTQLVATLNELHAAIAEFPELPYLNEEKQQ